MYICIFIYTKHIVGCCFSWCFLSFPGYSHMESFLQNYKTLLAFWILFTLATIITRSACTYTQILGNTWLEPSLSPLSRMWWQIKVIPPFFSRVCVDWGRVKRGGMYLYTYVILVQKVFLSSKLDTLKARNNDNMKHCPISTITTMIRLHSNSSM